MSQTTSLGAGKPYGMERFCRIMAFSHSSIYAQQTEKFQKKCEPNFEIAVSDSSGNANTWGIL